MWYVGVVIVEFGAVNRQLLPVLIPAMISDE